MKGQLPPKSFLDQEELQIVLAEHIKAEVIRLHAECLLLTARTIRLKEKNNDCR